MANANPITQSAFLRTAHTIDALETNLARAHAMLLALTGPEGVGVLDEMGSDAANVYLALLVDQVAACRNEVAALRNLAPAAAASLLTVTA